MKKHIMAIAVIAGLAFFMTGCGDMDLTKIGGGGKQ